MKKALTIMCLVLLGLIVSCNSNSQTSTIETTEPQSLFTMVNQSESVWDHEINSSFEDDGSVTFSVFGMTEEQKLPEKHFGAYFYDIEFTPIKDNISFSYCISDEDYQNATYILAMRESNSSVIHTFSTFSIGYKSVSFSSSFKLPLDLNNPEIIIAKIDLDDLNPRGSIDPVAGFNIIDSYKNQRKSLGTQKSTDKTPSETSIQYKVSYAQFDYFLEDPEEVVSKLTFILYDDEYGFNVLDYIEYDRDDILFEDNKLTFRNVMFRNILPEKEYRIGVVITGSNGIIDIENLLYSSFAINEQRFEGDYVVHQDLYAFISSVEEYSDELVVHHFSFNSGALAYSDTLEAVGLKLCVRRPSGNISYEIDIEPGEAATTISYDNIKADDFLVITDSRGEEVYGVYRLRELEPEVYVYTENGQLCVSIRSDLVTRVNLDLKYVGTDTELLETHNIDVEETGVYRIDLNLDDNDNILVLNVAYTVEFEQYGEILIDYCKENIRASDFF